MKKDHAERPIGIRQIRAMAQSATDEESLRQLVEGIYDADPVAARNAAWTMTHLTDDQIALLQPRQNEFIDLAMQTSNTSLRRLLLNVIERQEMDEQTLRTDFLDFCLEHMASPAEPPGVQTLCMKLAHRACSFYPELLKEFAEILQMMDDGYAICVKSLRRKMLSTLFSNEKMKE